jgi:hypothetical protein
MRLTEQLTGVPEYVVLEGREWANASSVRVRQERVLAIHNSLCTSPLPPLHNWAQELLV